MFNDFRKVKDKYFSRLSQHLTFHPIIEKSDVSFIDPILMILKKFQ
jgi:hypothetical protein